jgi:hypothetical protein
MEMEPRMVTFEGRMMNLSEWEREKGLGLGVLSARLSQGWTEERAIITPSRIFYGVWRNPLYHTWNGMHQRCYNPNHNSFPDYGGRGKRGIKVCKRWHGLPEGFNNFIADMGPRPEGMTLDRRNGAKEYSPENCRWATLETQLNNRRGVHYVYCDGELLSVSQAARKKGIKRGCLMGRLRLGWSVERALSTPVGTLCAKKAAA